MEVTGPGPNSLYAGPQLCCHLAPLAQGAPRVPLLGPWYFSNMFFYIVFPHDFTF